MYGLRTGRGGSCGAEEIADANGPLSWLRGTGRQDRQPDSWDRRLSRGISSAGLADLGAERRGAPVAAFTDDGPIRERGLIFSPALGSWPMTPCSTIPQPTCSGECETLRTCLSIRGLFAGTVICAVVLAGCPELEHRHGEKRSNHNLTSDTRHPVPLSSAGGKEHRAVMLQHLETIQVIMNALVEEDYELAKGLTELHLGFFIHRQAMATQQPGNFPPAYHDLATAHHEAAEELARIIPTKDIKQILPRFNNVLKACVACHLKYKVMEHS